MTVAIKLQLNRSKNCSNSRYFPNSFSSFSLVLVVAMRAMTPQKLRAFSQATIPFPLMLESLLRSSRLPSKQVQATSNFPFHLELLLCVQAAWRTEKGKFNAPIYQPCSKNDSNYYYGVDPKISLACYKSKGDE